MTEREQFDAWFAKQDAMTTPDCGYESIEGDLAFLAWMKCAAQYKKEIEALHDRLAVVIGQREELK